MFLLFPEDHELLELDRPGTDAKVEKTKEKKCGNSWFSIATDQICSLYHLQNNTSFRVFLYYGAVYISFKRCNTFSCMPCFQDHFFVFDEHLPQSSYSGNTNQIEGEPGRMIDY